VHPSCQTLGPTKLNDRESNMRTLLFLFLTFILFESNAAPAVAPSMGTYSLVKPNLLSFGRIDVTAVTYETLTFAAAVEFDPTPGTEGNVRNGGIESETIPRIGNMALFRAPPDDPSPCALVFVFVGTKQLELTQFGECSWFGLGVNASGRYRLQVSKGLQK
jgi:hypothetical protein